MFQAAFSEEKSDAEDVTVARENVGGVRVKRQVNDTGE